MLDVIHNNYWWEVSVHVYVATCNHAVGFNFQGNSGSSGFYGVKGKKVIVLIVSELLD